MSTAADDYQFDVNLRAERCNRIDQHIWRFVKLSQSAYENDPRPSILALRTWSKCESAFWQFDVRIVRDKSIRRGRITPLQRPLGDICGGAGPRALTF